MTAEKIHIKEKGKSECENIKFFREILQCIVTLPSAYSGQFDRYENAKTKSNASKK